MENEVNKKILNWGPYGACSVSWSFRILMGWERCIRNAYKRSKTLKIALILPMVYSYPSPRACMCLPIILITNHEITEWEQRRKWIIINMESYNLQRSMMSSLHSCRWCDCATSTHDWCRSHHDIHIINGPDCIVDLPAIQAKHFPTNIFLDPFFGYLQKPPTSQSYNDYRIKTEMPFAVQFFNHTSPPAPIRPPENQQVPAS